MRLFGWIGAGALSLLLGTSTAAFAQQDKEQEVRPPQQEEPKAEPKHEEAKPGKEEGRPPKQDEMKPPKHEDQKSQHEPERPEGTREHARPAGKSARIPDEKFRSHFGREHRVVINRPVIVEGRPRFQSSGYWFEIVDPWPVGWAYTDECYVDYVDGEYFLFDVLHPGVRIALFVTL